MNISNLLLSLTSHSVHVPDIIHMKKSEKRAKENWKIEKRRRETSQRENQTIKKEKNTPLSNTILNPARPY